MYKRTLLRVLLLASASHAHITSCAYACCLWLYLDGPLGLTSYITRPEQATHTQITRLLECTHGQDLRPLHLNPQGHYYPIHKASASQYTRSLGDQHPLML